MSISIFDKIKDYSTKMSLYTVKPELEASIEHGISQLTIKIRKGVDESLNYADNLKAIPISSERFSKATTEIGKIIDPIKKKNKTKLGEERERDARLRIKRSMYRCIRKKSCAVAIAARAVSFASTNFLFCSTSRLFFFPFIASD